MDGPQQNTKSWSGLLLLCRRTLIAWPSLLHNHSRVRAVRAQKAAHKDDSVCGLCEPCQFKWLLRVQKTQYVWKQTYNVCQCHRFSFYSSQFTGKHLLGAFTHFSDTFTKQQRIFGFFFTLILHMEPERRQSVSTLCYTVCR